jgi:hypothetical protein
MIEKLLRLLENGMKFDDAVRKVWDEYGRTGKVEKETSQTGEEVRQS